MVSSCWWSVFKGGFYVESCGRGGRVEGGVDGGVGMWVQSSYSTVGPNSMRVLI